jgi:Co/Zn/Cd efflux system component
MDLRRAVLIVAIANLAYFGVEFAVGWNIGSVSLFADSVDFLEDACVNFLIMVGLSWSSANRARLGGLLAFSIMLPAVATLWVALSKLNIPIVPAATPLAFTGLGALVVNLFCALLLARFRNQGGSLTRAAFLSARNDVAANVGIIGAGALTAATSSLWPDLIVGVAIGLMNLDAARQVFSAARREAVNPSAGVTP